MISAVFDKRNPERKRITEIFFGEADRFEIFISERTLDEIGGTQSKKLKRRMERLVEGYTVLETSQDVIRLADEYIRYGAIPRSHPDDARHIAFAVIKDIDYLVSWNFMHMVRMKTREIVRLVNTLEGMGQINILTPGELV